MKELPFWVAPYAVVLSGFTVFAAVDDHKAGRSVAWLTADIAATLCWLFFIVAYYRRDLAEPLGIAVVPLFALLLTWTGIAVHRDISEIDADPDPEMTPRENDFGDFLGIALGALLLSPAFLLAFRVAWGVWQAGS